MKGIAWRLPISVSLLTGAMLGFQIYLIHFLRIAQWQQFTNLIISMAMLGIGASGSFIAIFRPFIRRHYRLLVFYSLLICSLLICTLPFLLNHPMIRFDSYQIILGAGKLFRFVLVFAFMFLPFFFGSLVLGAIYWQEVRMINRLYFFDLVGAGTSSLLILILLNQAKLFSIGPICAILPLGSALIFSWGSFRKWQTTALAILAGLVIWFASQSPELYQSEYKALSKSLLLPKAQLEFEQHNAQGVLQVVSAPALRAAPGLSLNFMGKLPASKAVFINGHYRGSLYPNMETPDSFVFHTCEAVAYIVPKKRVLLIGATAHLGLPLAGKSTLTKAVVVEENKLLSAYLSHELAGDQFSIHWDNPRSFCQQSLELFDLVHLPSVGSFGGSLGLDAADESMLLSREALESFYAHLSDSGLMLVSCWIDEPIQAPYRLMASLSGMLRSQGCLVEEHLLIVRNWNSISILLKKSPFNQDDRKYIQSFCESNSFDLWWLGKTPTEHEFHLVMDSGYHELMDALAKGAIPSNFSLLPVADDRPYFYHFQKWNAFGKGGELAVNLLWIALATSLGFALLFIVAPLFVLKTERKGRNFTLAYFFAIGVGFFMVEMVFIKWFQQYLGNPIYSVALVILSMLVMSGIGAYFSSRFAQYSRWIWIFLLVLLALYIFSVPTIIQHLAWKQSVWRFLTCLILVAPPAFLMGMPFPMGLRLLDQLGKDWIPWAWGVNGFASVASVSASAIIMLEAGFRMSFLIGLVCYFVAAISFIRQNKEAVQKV